MNTLAMADSSLPTVMTLMENLRKAALLLIQDHDQHKGKGKGKGLTVPAALLERLPASLMQIQSVCLGIMMQRKLGDKSLQHWLNQVKDVVYDGDDVLGELRYVALASQTDSKVISSFLNSFLGKYQPVLTKLKALLERIDQIEKASQGMLIHPIEAVQPVPYTGFDPIGVEMIGREVERERLVSMLIDPMGASSGDQALDDYAAVGNIGMTGTLVDKADKIQDQVSVIAIVGVCGVGKTMLAQCVFDDPRIKDHFQTRIWVLCPEKFDEENLTRVIMDAAGLPNTLQSLDAITEHFTKFLLVLDDLCLDQNEIPNFNGWFQRWLAELHNKHRESRILVTTRHEAIAKTLSTKQLVLDRLTDSDACLLFQKHAFLRDQSSKACPRLQKISLKIVQKLEGVPLAAKIVGNMLTRNSSPEIWEEIVRKETISEIMELSLEKMPVFLKPLLYYCCVFPKRYRIERDELIMMWIAEGLIPFQEGSDKSLEDLGLEYFDKLVDFHVFQPLKEGHKIEYYLHGFIHDLTKSVCSKELITNCDCCDTMKPTVRRLYISDISRGGITCPWGQTLVELTSVRILDLSGCCIAQVPESLGHLIHLRYLALSKAIRFLPRSLTRLLHLQTLCIPEEALLNKLPERINKLISMRHLEINTRYIAGISGIGRMVNLSCSLEFHVKKRKGFNFCELKGLETIGPQLCIRNLENVTCSEALQVNLSSKKRVKSLSLAWSREIRMISAQEVLDALEPSAYLCELSIVCYSGNSSPGWLEEKWLCNLKQLYLINCNRWEDLPPLGQLPRLEVLHIKEMHAVKLLGPHFYGTDEDAFPSLKLLEFNFMPEFSEWITRDSGHSFHSLETLLIIDCPKLVFMPTIPVTVKKMELRRTRRIHRLLLGPSGMAMPRTISLETSSLSKLLLHEEHMKAIIELILWQCESIPEESGCYKSFTILKQLCIHQSEITDSCIGVLLQEFKTLSTLEIIGCPNIESVPIVDREIQLEVLHIRDCQLMSSLPVLNSSQNLKTLVVERCPMFSQQSLPSNMHHTLNSLKHFGVSHCPKFMSLPPHGFPTSLLSLSLVGCDQNLMKGLIDGTHADCCKIKRIPRVVIR